MGLREAIQRRFRSSRPTKTGIDVPGKLRNIKKLADAGKYDAAITLAYRTFEQMCGMKTGSERPHGNFWSAYSR
ncbi:MAG: hypothetical protein ACXADS_03370 [Candidatus Thorarchaeota archaeon]|jgi:hypothetical protein